MNRRTLRRLSLAAAKHLRSPCAPLGLLEASNPAIRVPQARIFRSLLSIIGLLYRALLVRSAQVWHRLAPPVANDSQLKLLGGLALIRGMQQGHAGSSDLI